MDIKKLNNQNTEELLEEIDNENLEYDDVKIIYIGENEQKEYEQWLRQTGQVGII